MHDWPPSRKLNCLLAKLFQKVWHKRGDQSGKSGIGCIAAETDLHTNAELLFDLRTVIELDVRAVNRGWSFIPIEQNADRCTASAVSRQCDYCAAANPYLGAPRGAQFGQSDSVAQFKIDRYHFALRSAPALQTAKLIKLHAKLSVRLIAFIAKELQGGQAYRDGKSLAEVLNQIEVPIPEAKPGLLYPRT